MKPLVHTHRDQTGSSFSYIDRSDRTSFWESTSELSSLFLFSLSLHFMRGEIGSCFSCEGKSTVRISAWATAGLK